MGRVPVASPNSLGNLKQGNPGNKGGRPKSVTREIAGKGTEAGVKLLVARLENHKQSERDKKPWPVHEVVAIVKCLHDVAEPRSKVSIESTGMPEPLVVCMDTGDFGMAIGANLREASQPEPD